MKKTLIFIAIVLAAVSAYWLFFMRQDSAPAEEAVVEPLPTQEDLTDAAERLRASAQGQESEQERTEQEAAAEALAATTTFDTMSSEEQEALIDAAEALKAK